MQPLLSLLFSFFQVSYAQLPEPLAYEYHLKIQPNYFSSTENLNNDGQKISLGNGSKFTNLTTRTSIYYSWLNSLQVLAGGDFAYSQSTRGNEDRSNLNFSEVFVGTRYFFERKYISLIPDVLLSLATSAVDPYGDEVLMSEHAHSLNLGLWSLIKLKTFFPYAYVGTKIMSDDRAWFYLLRLGLKYQLSDFSVYADICNTAPFRDDKNVETPQNRWIVTDRTNAGSYKFYSVNPEMIEFTLGSNFVTSETFKTGAQVSLPVRGRRVANGLSFMLSASWDFGSTLEVRDILQDGKKVKPKSQSKQKQFREQTEDEDQNLFEEIK